MRNNKTLRFCSSINFIKGTVEVVGGVVAVPGIFPKQAEHKYFGTQRLSGNATDLNRPNDHDYLFGADTKEGGTTPLSVILPP